MNNINLPLKFCNKVDVIIFNHSLHHSINPIKVLKNISKNSNGYATILENFKLFLFAYIFGKISPNNNIKNVATTTSKINFKIDDEILLKMISPICVNKITIAILIKLFATSIVANNLFGVKRSFEIIFIWLLFSLFFSWDLDKEKRATSEPEINPELINKKIKVMQKYIRLSLN